jgi:hypothetical protein
MAAQLMRFMRRYVRSVTQRKYRFNHWAMNCLCHADFWLERLPRLLNLSIEAIPVAAVVFLAATAEPNHCP